MYYVITIYYVFTFYSRFNEIRFCNFLRKILERPQEYKRVSNHKMSVDGEILTNISSENSNNIIRCFAYYTAFQLREFN